MEICSLWQLLSSNQPHPSSLLCFLFEQNAVSLEFNLRLIPVDPVYVRGQILVSVNVQTVSLTPRGAGST